MGAQILKSTRLKLCNEVLGINWDGIAPSEGCYELKLMLGRERFDFEVVCSQS